MQCVACEKSLRTDQILKCAACAGLYHYSCLNMTTAHFISNRCYLLQNWNCPECENVTNRTKPRNGDDTPVRRGPVDRQLDTVNMSLNELESNSQQQVEKDATHNSYISPSASFNMKQLSELLDNKLQVMQEFLSNSLTKAIKHELNQSIEKLKSDFTDTTDFLQKEQTDIKENVVIANNKISALEAENIKLQKDMNSLTSKMEEHERSSRSNYLEIQCVPEQRTENLYGIIRKICEEIKTPIAESEILSARRLGKQKPDAERPRPVLVKLPSECKRDAIILALKKYNKSKKDNPLNVSLLGFSGETKKIYFAEHLTPQSSELYAKTRKHAKEKGYTYIWVKYGRILVRKSEKSPAIIIKGEDCLAKLAG